MYDIFTTAYLFFLLCPGVVLSIGTGMTAAAIHAIVFFVILQYLSLYIPWWAVWVLGVPFISFKLYSGGAV
jgi:predicted membrane metal-binding protein